MILFQYSWSKNTSVEYYFLSHAGEIFFLNGKDWRLPWNEIVCCAANYLGSRRVVGSSLVHSVEVCAIAVRRHCLAILDRILDSFSAALLSSGLGGDISGVSRDDLTWNQPWEQREPLFQGTKLETFNACCDSDAQVCF